MNKSIKLPSFLNVIGWYVKILRPVNLVIIAATAFLSWKAVIGGVLESYNMKLYMDSSMLWLLILSLVLIAAGGYVINDYFDVDMDKVNKPAKQIVGSKIAARVAIVYYALLTTAGVICAVIVAISIGNYQVAMVHLIFALGLWFYSEQLKYLKFWGNFFVSISTAFVVIVMWLYEFFAMVQQSEFLMPQQSKFMNYIVLGYAGFAFLSTLAREMIKDRQDVKGDLQHGVRSLAVTMSDAGFKILIYGLLGLNLGFLIFAQLFLYRIQLSLISWYLLLPEFMVVYLMWVLSRARNEQDYGNMSLYAKAYILAGVVSMQVFYISW
ncbi:MAG: geranylgeranylglycerol-phosphate geranylgeranyltransferase [Bacteroidales bacterium]